MPDSRKTTEEEQTPTAPTPEQKSKPEQRQSESFDQMLDEQKGKQTVRDHDHFQADSSLSSEN